jgi:hypothetical protein
MTVFEVSATLFIEAPNLDTALDIHDDAMAAAQFAVPACKFSSSVVRAIDAASEDAP